MPKINISYKEGANLSEWHRPFVSNHKITSARGAKRLFCQYSSWPSSRLQPMKPEDVERFKAQGIANFHTKDGGFCIGTLSIEDYPFSVGGNARLERYLTMKRRVE